MKIWWTRTTPVARHVRAWSHGGQRADRSLLRQHAEELARVGVFFLKDGKIVEWYDYTIAMERS
jgi:hypothetical protein